MSIAANIVIGLIAVLHIYILVLEMFLRETPRARKALGLTPEFVTVTKVLAAKQGLYKGFLAAGLLWGCTWGRLASRSRFSSWCECWWRDFTGRRRRISGSCSFRPFLHR